MMTGHLTGCLKLQMLLIYNIKIIQNVQILIGTF